MVSFLNSVYHHPAFCFQSQSALFADIHSKSPLARVHPDVKLLHSRSKFLLSALNACMELIGTDLNPDGELVYDVIRYTQWVARVMDLGAEWGVSGDLLRRHQVCELYARGYDQLAQEVSARKFFLVPVMNKNLISYVHL